MRTGVINGNGFECDVCHELLYPEEVIRIKSFVMKPNSNTGEYITKDVMGVCKRCYDLRFYLLVDRGVSRKRIKKGIKECQT